MKTSVLKWLAIAPATVAALALTSCSSTPEGERETVVASEKGVPGGITVSTFQTTATVTAIDPATREVTLVSPAGKKATYKAGPDIVNFDQIHVGDQVKATVAEELVVYMATDAPPPNAAAMTVALAPEGSKPGGVLATTVQVTAKVTAIDVEHHKATLEFPDGSSHVVEVRKDIDLTKRQVGEQVVIRCTQAVAISVEKP